MRALSYYIFNDLFLDNILKVLRLHKSKVFTYLIMVPLNFEPYWSKINKRRIFKKNTIELNVGNPPWFIQTLSWRWDTSCEECYRQAFFTHFVGVTLCWGELTTHDWWMILLDYFWHGRKMFAWTILILFNLKRIRLRCSWIYEAIYFNFQVCSCRLN